MIYSEDEDTLDLDASVFVSKIAATIYSKRFDNSISFDDYKQYGFLGYLEAKEKYDPDIGVSFKTFAAYRVKGAILNGIVKYTEKINYYFHKKKSLNQRVNRIANSASENFFNCFSDMVVELVVDDMLDTVFEQLIVEPDASDNVLDRSKIAKNLLSAIDQLPETQKQIIIYHYFSDLSFQGIASMLDLSKSRISQLHKLALKSLCSKVTEYDDYLAYL